MKTKFKSLISKKVKPFIIAEISANHGGSLSKAIRMITAAKKAGASAVKIQTYEADSMTLDSNKNDVIDQSKHNILTENFEANNMKMNINIEEQFNTKNREPISERVEYDNVSSDKNKCVPIFIEFSEANKIPTSLFVKCVLLNRLFKYLIVC